MILLRLWLILGAMCNTDVMNTEWNGMKWILPYSWISWTKPNNDPNNSCRVFLFYFLFFAGSAGERLEPGLWFTGTLKGRGHHYGSPLKAVTLLYNLLWWEGSQTMDNEGLLASEMEQAKQNTKHSSQKAVITDKQCTFLRSILVRRRPF